MVLRLSVIAMLAVHVLCMTGCEQIKEYRMQAYYAKAQKLYEAQDYRAALKEVQYALAFNPDYVDAVALKGRCQYELKNYEDAAFTLEQALFLDASRDDLALMAAESFFNVNRFYRALNRTRLLREKDPDNVDVLYLEARIRLRSRLIQNWSGVETVLQALLSAESYAHEAFALMAEFYILNDDLLRAEAVLNEHAHLNEDWLFVMRMLAEKYEFQGDLQSAARIYGRVLELTPYSTEDVDALLAVLRRAGKKDEELQLLESLIAADAQRTRYKLKLVDFYIYCGRLEEAEKQIRSGIHLRDGYVEFMRYLVDIYEKTGRYSEAISIAKEVLSQAGDDGALQVRFMNILARLYYMTNNPSLARFVVRWVLSLDYNNHEARFLLSRIALDEGRTLLAIAELRGLGSEDAGNPDYDYYLALAHIARAEKNSAEQSLKEAIRKKPSHKEALLKLAELYFEKSFWVDVEKMVNDFLAVIPDDPDVLALKAELAHKKASAPEGD